MAVTATGRPLSSADPSSHCHSRSTLAPAQRPNFLKAPPSSGLPDVSTSGHKWLAVDQFQPASVGSVQWESPRIGRDSLLPFPLVSSNPIFGPLPGGNAFDLAGHSSTSSTTSSSSATSTFSNSTLQHPAYHYPRSSISSTGSHLFSPKLRTEYLSPATPPLHVAAQGSSSSMGHVGHEGASYSSAHTVSPMLTDNTPKKPAPAAPMPPGYVSRLSVYLAEMIVYLWYSPPKHKPSMPFPKPSTGFLKFCHDTLVTTQVSRSVVVLALLFVWKLQGKHCINPLPGSEYKLTIVALMLANKTLDDHTYTNKTWSDVTGLSLPALNEGEIEFLQGLEFNLFVSHTAFAAWVDLLEKPGSGSFFNERENPTTKRAKLSHNAVTPSAPNSPMHRAPTGAATMSHDALSVYHLPAPLIVPSSSSLSWHPAPQAQHAGEPQPLQGFHTLPQTLTQIANGGGVGRYEPNIHASATQRRLSPNSTMLSRTFSQGPSNASRKRRLSSASMDAHSARRTRRPSTSQTLQYPVPVSSSAQNERTDSSGSAARSGHKPDDIEAASELRLSAETRSDGINPPQEFSTLISRFSPMEDVSARNPGHLVYYALAAGQARGGYLAYQPVAPGTGPFRPNGSQPPLGVYYSHPSVPNRGPSVGQSPSGGTHARSMQAIPCSLPDYPPELQPPCNVYNQSIAGTAPSQCAPYTLIAEPEAHQSRSAPTTQHGTPSDGSASGSGLGRSAFTPAQFLPPPVATTMVLGSHPFQQAFLPATTGPAPGIATQNLRTRFFSNFANNGLPGVYQWPSVDFIATGEGASRAQTQPPAF